MFNFGIGVVKEICFKEIKLKSLATSEFESEQNKKTAQSFDYDGWLKAQAVLKSNHFFFLSLTIAVCMLKRI